MADNKPAYDQLVQAIANGAIALVGAGSSARVKYPLWGSLMSQIAAEVLRRHPEDEAAVASHRAINDTLVEAKYYEQRLGKADLRNLLISIFGPQNAPFDECHQDILRLPFSHILTGNYDMVLESAHLAIHFSQAKQFDFTDQGALRAFVDNLKSPTQKPTIVHFHGSINDPNHIVLTLDDYNARYQAENWATAALTSIFGVCQCVFIGCGLSEEDLGPLRFLAAVLGAGDPKHFALMEQSDATLETAFIFKLQSRYRVTPVFYPKSDHHQAIGPFLKQLVKDVADYQKQSPQRRDNSNAVTLDELTEALKDDPAALEAVRRGFDRIVSAAPTLLKDSGAVLANATERTPLDDELDDIFKYVQRGQPEVAIDLYERLVLRERNLTTRLRYRIHANIGNAFYSMRQFERAAEEYSKATPLRDTRDARALGIMAYQLRKEYPRAHELAAELCRAEPDFPRAYWLLLASLPKGTPFKEAEALIPEQIRSEAEVATALAGIAFDGGQADDAVRYGRLAVAASPDWPEAILNLSAAIIMKERSRACLDIDRGLIPFEGNSLQEADSLLTQAIGLIPLTDPAKLLAMAYLNRASARRLLGKVHDADADTREAHRLRPNDPDFNCALAVVRDRAGDKDGAIELLKGLKELPHLVRPSFLLSLLLNERGASGDREHAAEILEAWLKALGQLPEGLVMESTILYTMVCADMGVPTKAREFLDKLPEGVLKPGRRDLLLGRTLLAMKDLDGAKAALLRCAEPIRANGHWEDRREAAMLAHNLGEFRISLDLWRCIISTERLSRDNLRALRTAELARDDAFILEHCRALREKGIETRDLSAFEINALVRCHEIQKALSLLQALSLAHPDDKVIRLHYWHLALVHEEPNVLHDDPSKLPSTDEVKDAVMGAVVLQVLRHGLKSQAAATYAYDLWRRFPDEMAAQFALISMVLDPAPGQFRTPPQPRVTADCAFRYQEVGTDRRGVAVIETGRSPSVTRFEYPVDHALSQAVAGKAVGDYFQFQGHKHQILAIESKIVFRARECLEGFEQAFPDNPVLKRMTVGPERAGKTNARDILGDEVFRFLEDRNRRSESLTGLYAQHAISLSQLAKSMGNSMIETIGYLASNPNLGVRSGPVEDDAWKAAVHAVQSAKRMVLDSSAIATLFMLNLHHKLRDLPFRCVVPDSAIQEVREIRCKSGRASDHIGFLGFHDGQPVFQEVTKEQQDAWAARLDELVSILNRDCEIVGGLATLDLKPEHRDGLTRVLGPAAAHAVGIAVHEKIPLWTDDHVMGAMSRNEWKIEPVWTQSVLFGSRTGFSPEEIGAATVRMFIWGYQFTRLTIDAVFQLFRDSNWDPDREPARRAIALIRDVVPLNCHNCALTSELIVKLWFDGPNEQQMRLLIGRLLTHIGSPIAGAFIARPLYRTPFSNLREPIRSKRRRLSRFLRNWRCHQPSNRGS